jgi:hypothetical protein
LFTSPDVITSYETLTPGASTNRRRLELDVIDLDEPPVDAPGEEAHVDRDGSDAHALDPEHHGGLFLPRHDGGECHARRYEKGRSRKRPASFVSAASTA